MLQTFTSALAFRLRRRFGAKWSRIFHYFHSFLSRTSRFFSSESMAIRVRLASAPRVSSVRDGKHLKANSYTLLQIRSQQLTSFFLPVLGSCLSNNCHPLKFSFLPAPFNTRQS